MDEIPPSITQYTNKSISAVHHSLRSGRRRLVIGLVAHRALSTWNPEIDHSSLQTQRQEIDHVVSVRQVAKEIVAIENDVSLDEATGDPYHNVYTSLIQTHLPELDDVGAIKYNSDRKRIKADCNLIALAIVASLSSPIVQMLFHSAFAKSQANGMAQLEDSTDD